MPGTDAVPVFSKVAIDQLFWCPIFMSVFFTYLGLVNGDSLATIGNKIKNDLLTACQGSWKVWPLVSYYSCSRRQWHNIIYVISNLSFHHISAFPFLGPPYQLQVCLQQVAHSIHQRCPNRIQHVPFTSWI